MKTKFNWTRDNNDGKDDSFNDSVDEIVSESNGSDSRFKSSSESPVESLESGSNGSESGSRVSDSRPKSSSESFSLIRMWL